MLIIPLLALMSCGESEKEKQKRLNDELMKNVSELQSKLTADTNQLNRDIRISKAK